MPFMVQARRVAARHSRSIAQKRPGQTLLLCSSAPRFPVTLVSSLSDCQKMKNAPEGALVPVPTGPKVQSITPGPPCGDPRHSSIVQSVIQRNFRVQQLRNRAARFGFIDDLIKGGLINTGQRDGTGQRHFSDGKAVAFLIQ